ncbi:PLP-dependent transferase [Exidia glandulosa HHB12029]|uniref:PLP-dependent transferase n=1 Tax=Exidia glandulosa HHB12029 TaxID=1314781 RepID=A0A165E3Z7_EXIGL|nr:PLP-dependent transferase [Exidia glandulosa HHB12029]
MSSYNEKARPKANAVELGHHLSELSKKRTTSPLKGMQKLILPPGTIKMAGGQPDPLYFPFASIGGEAMAPDSYALQPTDAKPSKRGWFDWFMGKERTTTITIPRFPTGPNEMSLADSLQYGPATGVALLQTFINDFVERVYAPNYENWTTLVHVGNTDGWSRAVQTLCNPGELILTEEWTYPSAVANSAPYDVKPVAVGMDSEGMSASALEDVLANWDETERGAKRPHVMYTVPVGQNPCGMTMGIERKKEIYEICVKYDVIIVEDDPYYFLQEGTYIHKTDRAASSSLNKENKDFVRSLAPSYLAVDYQGRVVRLDTFSKTIAPGSRMGFFTCNPVFAERLERQGETTVQRPCGFGQALIGQLLTKQWGLDAYIRWLHGLQAQYTARRDALVDGLLDGFEFSLSYGDGASYLKGLPVYSCFPKKGGRSFKREKQVGRMLSFVAPTSGMFVWVTVHFEGLPPVPEPEDPEDPRDHETRLWVRLASAGLLISPGAFFASTAEVRDKKPGEGHYRIAFSMGPLDELTRGMKIFGKEVHAYYEESLRA